MPLNRSLVPMYLWSFLRVLKAFAGGRAALCMLLWTGLCGRAQSPAATLAHAQQATSTLSVVDPSGAKVARAQVRVFRSEAANNALLETVQTDPFGNALLALPEGDYLLQVQVPGFTTAEQAVHLCSGRPGTVTIKLRIAAKDEAINVSSEGDAGTIVDGQALVLRGKALDALSNDPTTLQQQIDALVSTDDGQAPQLRVDGFSNGTLPPKSAIREVRVNQNAYSAQFDQRGAVVDIFTRPGASQLRGTLYFQGNADPMNARNPFLPTKPGYRSLFFDGNVNGPIRKNTSFFVGADVKDTQNSAAIRATVLDAALNPVSLVQTVYTPLLTGFANARIDHQFGERHTLTVRADWAGSRQQNGGLGLGQLVLPSQGYLAESKVFTFQVGETTVVSPQCVMETRFQYRRARTSQTANSTAPALVVEGAFAGGGAPTQSFRDATDYYEFQEYLSVSRGKHYFRGGLRYRETRDSNSSTANFNGQYVFTSIQAYQTTLRGLAANEDPSLIRAQGGGASQYSVTGGTPAAIVSTGDLGVYFEDEWRVRPNFTLNPGLRFESQYGIPDHSDPAPRLGFAWMIGNGANHAPLLRVRGGVGLFYDRVAASNLLTTVRNNGVLQQQYFLENPDTYPVTPSPAQLSTTAPTVYQLDPRLRSQYLISEGVTVDHRFNSFGVSLAYTHDHGVHLLLSRNANAPVNGVRPAGGTQNVYQFASLGTSNVDTISPQFGLAKGRVNILVNYTLRFRQSDSGGPTSFVSDSYNVHADYGRPAFLTRSRATFTTALTLPYAFYATVFGTAHSATHYNVTTGYDNNGDSIYNDRPAFATDLSRPSVVRTAIGNFDTQPVPGRTIVPINYGVAPSFFSLQVRLQHETSFGRRIKDSPLPKSARDGVIDRFFHLYVGAEAQNLTNRVNGSTPVGELTSPDFGRSLTLNAESTGTTAANRVVNVFAVLVF